MRETITLRPRRPKRQLQEAFGNVSEKLNELVERNGETPLEPIQPVGREVHPPVFCPRNWFEKRKMGFIAGRDNSKVLLMIVRFVTSSHVISYHPGFSKGVTNRVEAFRRRTPLNRLPLHHCQREADRA